MKRLHYMLMLLALLVCQNVRAQFNPEPPDEPGARPWQLTLKAVPAEAGYFNLNQQSRHAAGEVMQLTAYTNSGYRFVCWEDSMGNTLTTERSWSYTMPENDVTLTARYEYSPNTPDEPGQASIKKRLFLTASPAGAGNFNLSSTNNIAVGQAVNLRVYANQNYIFRNWTEDGTIISSAAAFTYTMPDKDVTLTANFDFDYQPATPDEPGQPQLQTCTVYAMREDAVAGQDCTFPVYFENNGSDVTGFAVDVSFPQGFTVNADSVTLTGSVAAHSLSVSQPDAGILHFEVSGSSVVEKGDGKALLIPVITPVTATAGAVYTVELRNGTMAKADGSQTSIKVRSGSLRIVQAAEEKPDSPDYVVADVQTTSSDVNPGDEIQVSWEVKNEGRGAGPARWTERLYLLSSTGRKVSIGTTNYDGGQLQPGEAVSRTATLPLGKMPGIDGRLNIIVTITPSASAGEAAADQENNTTVTTGSPINLAKLLYLTLPEAPQAEGSVKTIRCQLARSGDWRSNETFTVKTIKGDSRISLPETIFIPRDQSATYFYLPMADNNICDTDTMVSFSIEGNGYPAVTGQIAIEDDEQPSLSLTASKSVVSEGETFQLTFTAGRAPAEDLTVTLTSENNNRFTCPRKATIPAGQTSVTVDVTAKDDDLPSQDLSNAFIASAPRYTQGEVIVLLQDNDMPVLQLVLTPNKIAEGAGPISVAGVLRRTGVTNNKITVRLSDDSNGGLYFTTRELVLNAGVEEASFNFGPVDNVLVDGDHTYTVTAAVWLSSCSCSAGGESAGSVSAQLQVLDDDGPALTLTSEQSTICEGGKTVLTVRRNTSAAEPLAVTLSSDYDDNLSYQRVVTIPAGQLAAQVEVTSMKNDESGDTYTAVFTALADGFASGTCWLMVTDQTLPDAAITAISMAENEVEAGGTATVCVTVKNSGFAPLPSGISLNFHLAGDNSLIGTTATQQALEAGTELSVTAVLAVPMAIGAQMVYCVANEEHSVSELSYTNNTSVGTPIRICPPFTANVAPDKTVALPGETVMLNGTATGAAVGGKEVEVYLMSNGVRQTIAVVTDAEGHFQTTYTPRQWEAGHVSIGACYPGEGLQTEQSSIEVIGLHCVAGNGQVCETLLGVDYPVEVEVENPMSTAQTQIGVEVVSAPAGCRIALPSPAAQIEAGGRLRLRLALHGDTPSEGNDWETIMLRVISQEGAQATVRLQYYCSYPAAQLSATPSAIQTAVTLGNTHDYPLTITNIGAGETGNLSLALPSFISLASSQELPSLGQNESTTVILRFSCPEGAQANIPISGDIGVNCTNGNGIALPYTLTPVAEHEGRLTVDVCDEFTYYSPDGSAPHVAGAVVTAMLPFTNQVVATGTTGEDGLLSMDLQAGYYMLSVTAENHESYANYVVIDPGTEKTITINLSYEGGISVEWEVVETEVEDEYEIVTTVTYETNVPEPVLILDAPNSIPANDLGLNESLLFYATLTNKGLIAIHDAQVVLPQDSPGLLFEALANDIVDILMPQESIVVPIKVTRVGNESGSSRMNGRRKANINPEVLCADILIPTGYWDCGVDKKWYRKGGKPINLGRTCVPSDFIGDSDWRKRSDLPLYGRLSGANFNPYIPNFPSLPSIPTKETGCIPCLQSRTLTLVDCALSFVPAYRYVKGIFKCIKDVYNAYEVFTTPNLEKTKYAGAILQAMSTCAAAKNGSGSCFSDDKAKRIMDTILFKLGEVEGMLAQGNIDQVTSWNSIVDNLGTLASVLNDIAGGTWDCIKELACPLKLLEPCKTGTNQQSGTGGGGGGRIRAMEPAGEQMSYYVQFQRALAYGVVDMLAVMSTKYEFFGNPRWLDVEEYQLTAFMDVFQSAQNADGFISEEHYAEILAAKPAIIDNEAVTDFIQRWNNTVTDANSENKIDTEKAFSYFHLMEKAEEAAQGEGYESIDDCIEHELELVKEHLDESSKHVCASVTLQITQDMVMTRQAFQGTLTIKNGHETAALTDARLHLIVKDEEGNIATEQQFSIDVETLQNFEGEKDLEGGWSLSPNQTGTATIRFVPTRYAAPTTPKKYSFGGMLTFTNPYTNMESVLQLMPITLTVSPSPLLDLDYFMQRDIYGDDPLTEDTVEQMVPAEFALIINNKGAGEARNVRLTTRQPQIVDNEKGLAVEFSIIGSSLNGQPANMVMSDSYATDFGTIAPHSQSYAQWWLTSTLLGHFTNYDVTVNHMTSYDTPDLSLIDQATMHELIHGFTDATVEHGLTRRGFLVNDITDADDLPDRVYFTDATQYEVHIGRGSVGKQGNNYVLTLTPSLAGWNYGSVADPTGGTLVVAEVTRLSDGAELPADNVWQTNRTLRDGRDWLYENRLHWVALLPEGGESYLLTFKSPDEVATGLTAANSGGQHQLRLSMRGDWLTITGEGFSELRHVETYDLRGIKRSDVRSVSPGQAIYAGQLPPGVYYIVVTTDSGICRQKVLKRK